jgi:DegV family protein with EDD domain
MPTIRVVTDSTCDLPESLLNQYGIEVVRHTVRAADGEAYPDGVGMATGHLLERMRANPGAWPTVEPPQIDDLVALYRSLRDSCDGILSVHMSSKVSESYRNAMAAREVFGPVGQGGPFPIAVVDSLQTSMALGWMVLALARAAATGEDLSKLAARATRLSERCHLAFFAERFDGLQRAGRGIRSGSGGDNISHMRPLFHLDEGQIVVYERTRTRAKARDALYNFVEDFPKIGEIAVIHTGALFDLEHLMTRVGAIYPRERVFIIQAGPATSAWMGPDALGVGVIEAEDYL